MPAYCKVVLLFLTLLGRNLAWAQITYDSSKIISGIIYMDSSIVVEAKRGFNIDDFIRMVKEDTTFYRAFQNLRYLDYDFSNDIKATFSQSGIIGTYQSECHQSYQQQCRSMQCGPINVSDAYYKKGNPVYFTSQLYERLFFTRGLVCNQKRGSATLSNKKRKRVLANPVEEIKIIMFSPGRRSSLPIIGKKMDIFHPRMSKYYQFNIQSSEFEGMPCYVFSTQVKPNYKFSKINKTVLKDLKTYFHKKDFQILYREYLLEYRSSIVKFKIHMQIRLDQYQHQYYPAHVFFKGYWDVPTKKTEQSEFELLIQNVSDHAQ